MSISISKALDIIKANNLVAEKVAQNPTNRLDESMIFDSDLCQAMTDIAKSIYPETKKVTFSKNRPVIMTNQGWLAGKKVDRRGLVDRFKAQELTEDEIKTILQDCLDSPLLTTENTPQFDWDGFFSRFEDDLRGMTREEWLARWGLNRGDLPTTPRDPIETAKNQRLRAMKRAKDYHNATAEKGDMIPFSIDAVKDVLLKIGAITRADNCYLPGTPYIVPNKGIIRLRLTRKDGTESNNMYKTTKIDVFRDPTHPKGRFGDTPFRWEPISGYLCSKADLEAACQELKTKDWEDIKAE